MAKRILNLICLLLGPTQILTSLNNSCCYQDIDDLDEMLLVEEWQSRTDLEGLIASE
jgi:hypothetical protein